ncbi:hypothetical protein [uncultured Cellulomonas sp.]|uniref:hypothetical protein n=1 Tax=uncultured Cellulomonas sp. TaxID=189682 RepID=UPI00261AB612|nr:hypothetical protein [uncultured Cellulomonas sp.]
MLWFTVWSVLVVATLASAVWLGRDLWRKGRALMAELERAADVVGQMADRADELTAAAAAAAGRSGHDVLTDPQRHREHLVRLRAARDARRAERRRRHTRTFTRWQRLSR